ncbi:MAG: prepilin-type N-terminal cleavage/methylation domain-containing protein [Candidatus Omnitrophica bacterium]|nr:prepilin-type N-terminal cleavage/methylation domain-containing protein [Candidatus Omnitrophota bacterium]
MRIRSGKGFSITEILIVVAIIGFIMMIAIPNYLSAKRDAECQSCLANQKTIFTTAKLYMISEDSSLEGLSAEEQLGELIDKGYLKSYAKIKCPSSGNENTGYYELVFDDGILTDIDCTYMEDEHQWL